MSLSWKNYIKQLNLVHVQAHIHSLIIMSFDFQKIYVHALYYVYNYVLMINFFCSFADAR